MSFFSQRKKKKDLCLSAPPEEAGSEAGRAAIAFHWQADKQGAAWRQKGHYQRLGQTEIRASFGPGRQASTHTYREREREMERKKEREGAVNFTVERLESWLRHSALWKCQLWNVQIAVRLLVWKAGLRWNPKCYFFIIIISRAAIKCCFFIRRSKNFKMTLKY